MAEVWFRPGGPKDWVPSSSRDLVKVIFRTWPEGDVDAFFPELPADHEGRLCTAYGTGGHGGADLPGVMDRTRPSTPEEYKNLLRHLGAIGYTRLKVMKRTTREMDDKRRENASLF